MLDNLTGGASEKDTFALFDDELEHSLLFRGKTELLVNLEMGAGQGRGGRARAGFERCIEVVAILVCSESRELVESTFLLGYVDARLLTRGWLHEVPGKRPLLLDRLSSWANRRTFSSVQRDSC